MLDGLAARGVDPARTFLGGDSGGGGLAATVLYERGLRAMPALAGVLLFSPEVSLLLDRPSVRENAATDVLPWNIPTNSYLHGLEPDDVAVSAGDVSAWPPAFVAFGDDEMFRDAIRDLVDRLRDAAIPTQVHEMADMFHVFPMLMPWADGSRTVFAAAGEWVVCQLSDQGCAGLGGSPSSSDPSRPRAPDPLLAGLERLHERMAHGVEVRGGVLVRGGVAAADVTALEAAAEVHPARADREAVDAPLGAGWCPDDAVGRGDEAEVGAVAHCW